MSQDFLKSLNQEQYQAATFTSGYELMLAGAGTGKTHTLITRVAYLISQGVSPNSILLLTFTRKAADEMRNRLVEYIGSIGEQVWAMTFHAFANRVLSFAPWVEQYHFPEFTIMNDGDDREQISDARSVVTKNMSKDELLDFPKVALIQKVIEASVNQRISVDVAMNQIGDDSLGDYFSEVLALIDLYQQRKAKSNYVTYSDLLEIFLQQLRNNVPFRNWITSKFVYVMCDEYQDTNILQEAILSELTCYHKNLCVVGDDNQSIYRFRSAEIRNILTYKDRYPDVKVVPLVQNYRSTQAILNVSNAMMLDAKEGIPKQLVAVRSSASAMMPRYTVAKNDKMAAEHVLRAIEYRHQYMNVPYLDMAVLVRTGNGSTYVEQLCAQKKVPFVKYGGRKFTDKHNVAVILAYLRILVNEKDILAWGKVLSEYPGLGVATKDKITDAIMIHGADAVLYPKKYMKKVTRIVGILSDFKGFYDRYCTELTISGKFSLIKKHYASLLSRQMQATKSTDTLLLLDKRLDELDSDIGVLQDMAKGSRSVKQFLSDVVLDMVETNDNKSESGDVLTISTIHSVKGLEYDSVFLLHPIDEYFFGRDGDVDALNEERRIMYVALTRAKNYLELVQAVRMQLNGKYLVSTMSTFLDSPAVRNTLTIDVL